MKKDVNKWDKVFKNGPSKICRMHPLKILSQMSQMSQPFVSNDVVTKIRLFISNIEKNSHSMNSPKHNKK